MAVDIFGFEKDERIDNEWHLLVEKLESTGWQRESFTTLYETGHLFIPDAPEVEMSFETQSFLFNVTAFLSEKKIYLSIAPNPDSGLKGQLTLVTQYGAQLDSWLEAVNRLPDEITTHHFSDPLNKLIHLFPDSSLEVPIENERVSVAVGDPISQKVLKTPWCRKGPNHELILDESDRNRLQKMVKLNSPYI